MHSCGLDHMIHPEEAFYVAPAKAYYVAPAKAYYVAPTLYAL